MYIFFKSDASQNSIKTLDTTTDSNGKYAIDSNMKILNVISKEAVLMFPAPIWWQIEIFSNNSYLYCYIHHPSVDLTDLSKYIADLSSVSSININYTTAKNYSIRIYYV